MNYFKFTLDRIKQNPHIVFLYLVVFLLANYTVENIFGINLNNATKEEYLAYFLSYKYYLILIGSILVNSFFAAGLWYSFTADKELGFKEYIDKSIHFFKRFIVIGFIGFLIIISMSLSLFINNKILAVFYIIFFLLALFYISVKISLTPAYIVYLDLNIFEAFKRSYFAVRGGYFWTIVVFSIIKSFLAKNQILASFLEVLMISFLCFIFVKIQTPEIEEEVKI